jgi:hypothetical protein
MSKFNISTKYGNRNLKVLSGNVAKLNFLCDVLIISVLGKGYDPVPNTVLGSLQEAGILVDDLQNTPLLDLRNDLKVWISKPISNSKFRYILCVEMDNDHLDEKGFQSIMGNIFSLFSVLQMKQNISIKSIVMPILGTGFQKRNPEEIVPFLLSSFRIFLDRYKELNEITICDKDTEKAKKIESALGKYFKVERDEIEENQTNDLVQEVKEKIISQIDKTPKVINGLSELTEIRDYLKSNEFRFVDLANKMKKFIAMVIPKNDKGDLDAGSIKKYFSEKKRDNIYTTMTVLIRDYRNMTEHKENNHGASPYKREIYDTHLLMICFYKFMLIE